MSLTGRGVLSSDTSRDAEAAQIAIWRSMSTVEKSALIRGASEATRALALAGLRDRHPDLSDQELVPHLALLTLGPDLAYQVYPELSGARPATS